MAYSVVLSQLPILFVIIVLCAAAKSWPKVLGKGDLTSCFYAFICGILIFLPAYFIQFYLSLFLVGRNATESQDIFIQAFFIIACSEEVLKFICLRFILFKRAQFNKALDGVTYGLSISLGFAAVENAIYFTQYGIGQAWVRIFSAVPMHVSIGIILGYFFGQSKSRASQFNWQLRGLILVCILHGFYNYLLLSRETWSVIGAGVILLSQLILACVMIRKSIGSEDK